MIKHFIRNLDHKTSKLLAVAMKDVLFDHIQFIEDINRILILNTDNAPALKYSKKFVHPKSRLGRLLESPKGIELSYSGEFNYLNDIHISLQLMATKLLDTVQQTGGINIDEYEEFLVKNDIFIQLLWRFASEVVSAQYQFDPLTKLLNRKFFKPILKHELSRANRHGTKCCLVLVDIDDFKNINDTFGHSTGDSILREFSSVIRLYIRESDCASRHGGEEFLLCLPDTDIEMAQRVIERLSKKIADYEYSEKIQLTASFGIAPLSGEIRQSIVNADIAMYNSKNNGKNQVSIFK